MLTPAERRVADLYANARLWHTPACIAWFAGVSQGALDGLALEHAKLFRREVGDGDMEALERNMAEIAGVRSCGCREPGTAQAWQAAARGATPRRVAALLRIGY